MHECTHDRGRRHGGRMPHEGAGRRHHHRHGGFGRGLGGPGPRARRGHVQAGILALLGEQSMHGYQIIQELADRSGGAWAPSPGSVYPTLQMLEDQGLVTSEQTGGKRVYTITDAGRAKIAESGGKAPWDELAGGGGGGKLREAIASVAAASMQVARTGSAEQVEEVLGILVDARRRIYLLLAEAE